LSESNPFETLGYKTFQHKRKVTNLRDRRSASRRKTDLPISFPDRRNKDRRVSERRIIERRIEEVRFDITNKLKKNSERLWDFYLKCNFLYPAKISFLTPVKDEVLDTIEKLTNCTDNTCKFIFIMDKEEIIGSVMAVQYTDDTWMVQHIVTSPRHIILTKELILQILIWMMQNKKMHYFLNYYREQTRWASKTYQALVDHIKGPRIAIEHFDYMYMKLSDYVSTQINSNINISEAEPNKQDYNYIYNQLIKTESEIYLNTVGIKHTSCSIKQAEENYSKNAITRIRNYFIARSDNAIVGFAFADISSYGISLSLLFNVFQIFILDKTCKEELYRAILNRINSTLIELNKVYSIGIINPEDRIYLENLGYQCSRSYSAFVVDRKNEQFAKSYDIINSNRK